MGEWCVEVEVNLGAWVSLCSDKCADSWVELLHKPPQPGTPPQVRDAAGYCTHCTICGLITVIPADCVLHGRHCREWAVQGTIAGGAVAATFAAAVEFPLPPRFFEYLEQLGHHQRVAGTWPHVPSAIMYMHAVRIDWEP